MKNAPRKQFPITLAIHLEGQTDIEFQIRSSQHDGPYSREVDNRKAQEPKKYKNSTTTVEKWLQETSKQEPWNNEAYDEKPRSSSQDDAAPGPEDDDLMREMKRLEWVVGGCRRIGLLC